MQAIYIYIYTCIKCCRLKTKQNIIDSIFRCKCIHLIVFITLFSKIFRNWCYLYDIVLTNYILLFIAI